MTLKQIADNHGLTPDGIDYALNQYQIIVNEITHGLLSKLTYDAHDILQVAQERWCDTCELTKAQDLFVDWLTQERDKRMVAAAAHPKYSSDNMDILHSINVVLDLYNSTKQ